MELKIIFSYLLFINLLAIIVCIYDKAMSKKKGRRVSERFIWAVAIAGGSICMYITMNLIHHKVRHRRFMFGMPLIIVAQIAFSYALTHRMF